MHRKTYSWITSLNVFLLDEIDIDVGDDIGFALYLLTVGWKQERSIGVIAKRRGRESVIDLKSHSQTRFCSVTQSIAKPASLSNFVGH